MRAEIRLFRSVSMANWASRRDDRSKTAKQRRRGGGLETTAPRAWLGIQAGSRGIDRWRVERSAFDRECAENPALSEQLEALRKRRGRSEPPVQRVARPAQKPARWRPGDGRFVPRKRTMGACRWQKVRWTVRWEQFR
jgi:hypothetical protein